MPWTDTGLRAATLDTTRTLLVRDGYENLSMRKIARAVGCSVSSIYLYFANKDQLVHALIDEGFQRWYDVVAEAAGAPGTPPERLELHCRKYVQFGLENPEYYEIMYLLHPNKMERIPKEMFRRAARSMDILAQLVHECAPDAFRSAEEARIHAHVVWAILHGVVSTLLAARVDTRIDRSAYIDSSIRFAVDAVRRLEPAVA
ncbi:MAG TPA: TetR/AcrR family transcriptional regulator [Longimicrobiaceae bacterium]|nr:TetR/AcrR family transcriptional regulator [Longimicrobiaceae bacterium]